MILLESISKHYQMGPTTIKALDEVSFRVHQNEFISIIGASGSGKSTMMNIIGCLDLPTKGDYHLDSEKIDHFKDKNKLAEIRNRKIGFVFQSFYLISKLNALENVELPLIYQGIDGKKRKEMAMEMLKKMKMDDRSHHQPNELSGGQRQRVAIARALVTNPAIILADEPTGALDSKTSIEILSIFKELNDEGKTVVLITHEKDIALKANRMIELKDGKIINDKMIDHQIEKENDS